MPIMTKTEAAGWRDYFALLEELRNFAVWQHEEDGEDLASGRRRPPRFVAVLEDEKAWSAFEKRVAALPITARYPIQMFDQVWGWARVQVNTANASKRLPVGETVVLGEVKRGEEGRASEVVAALVAAGHRASIEGDEETNGAGLLSLTPQNGGLTVRWSSGRAFRLYAWSEEGEPLHQKLQCGAVVVRACGSVEDDSARRRKPRADRLKRLTSWGEFSVWQSPKKEENRYLPYYEEAEEEVSSPETVVSTVGLFAGDGGSVEQLRLLHRPSHPKPNHIDLLDALEAGGRLVGSEFSWSLINKKGETVRRVDWRTVSALRKWGCLVTG